MNKKINWAKAATNGLFLSFVAIIADYIVQIGQIEGSVTLLISLLKLSGSTALLYYFIKKNFIENGSTLTYGPSFRYGMAVSLFSTVVCTLATLVLYNVIIPGRMEEMVIETITMYESMGLESITEILDYDRMMRTLPITIAVSQIFNCLIWGLILSAITANFAKVRIDNPFGNVEE